MRIITSVYFFIQVKVTRIQTASPAVEGTIDLEFADGSFESITGIPHSSSEAEMKRFLESADGIDEVEVTKVELCQGYVSSLLNDDEHLVHF